MKRKAFFGTLMILLLLFGSSIAIGEDKRLGYGFEPGLVPGTDFVAGQLIVGIKEGVSIQGVKHAVLAAGVQIAKEKEGAILLQFGSEKDALDAVPVLLRRPDVAFVERNGFLRIPPKPTLPDPKCGGCDRGARAKGEMNAQSVSSDPGTGYQWHHTVIRKTAVLPLLSTIPPTVAVIDTGVDWTHPDLSSKVILGFNCVANNYYPMDDNGHGTHVAGIIGAKAGNLDYGEGVCPNCKILAVKVLGPDGSGTFFDVAQGMAYARTAITTPATRVINMSLGGPASSLIAAEVLAIKNAGRLLVAAAGNDNTTSTTYAFPGADPNTGLRVMATDPTDCRAWFSNFSPSTVPSQYNIAAPGWGIYSTLPEAGFGALSGTSMASPVAAGAAALVWGQAPTLTRDQLISRMVSYGKTINCGFAASTKRVDVRKAITLTSETAIVGGVLDPFTAKAPTPGTYPAYARLKSGTTQLAYDLTNRGGAYEMTDLAAGTLRNLSGDRTTAPAYINTMLRYPITIYAGIVAGPYLDALPMARATGNATILLDWNKFQPVVATTGCTGACLGWEFDLFVKTPAGSYIYWDKRGDLLTSPYVRFARDSYDDALPMETIVIGSLAVNGTYKVFADKYPFSGLWNPSWAGARASLQAYNGSTSSSPHYYTNSCTTQRYWHVGNLTKAGTSYTWANVNLCTNTIP